MKDIKTICKKIILMLKNANKTIAFMESCTGGFLANSITNINTSSQVLKVSLIAYSNKYKVYFGVNENTILKYGVYSKETVEEMAKQVSEIAEADYGVGVSGQLCEIDKNNITDNINKVFYSIYDKNNNKYYTEIIDLQPKTREDLKLQIAKIIFERMITII